MKIEHPPYIVHGNEWAWEKPPYLFKHRIDSLQGHPSTTETGLSSCPSLEDRRKPCRCFDCDSTAMAEDITLSKFSPFQMIGNYGLFIGEDIGENYKYKFSRYQSKIEIGGQDYLHPTLSAKKLSEVSIKSDVVSAYLQFLANPLKKIPETSEAHSTSDIDDEEQDVDGNGNQSDDDDDDDDRKERDVPKEIGPIQTAYSRARGFRLSDDAKGTSNERVDIVGEIDYTEELAGIVPKSRDGLWALKVLAFATQVYLQLEGATISLKILQTPLNEVPWLRRGTAKWCKRKQPGDRFFQSTVPLRPRRSSVLGCIAYFESGTLLLPPRDLEETLAIASGNSIFVIGALISDPFDVVPESTVKRIVGNIGSTGICMLIAPVDPQIRPLGDQYNLVTHAAYDGERENNFKSTSLHLSFTEWKLPVDVKGAGPRMIDQEAYFVESVISVLESGKWVADLDILCIDFLALTRLRMETQCSGHPHRHLDYDYTSLDSWEELLDTPMSVGIFRARGNWAARLAAVSILSQKGQAHSIGVLGPEPFCLECLGSIYGVPGGLKKYESPLPSICID